jgi:hypothetical protein
LAYRLVAERDNQRVTKERTSALILVANARVWASEGWQVSITDSDGKEFDPASFEHWLGPLEASPLQPVNAASSEEPQETQSAPEAELPIEASEKSDTAEEAEHIEPQELETQGLEIQDLESEELESEENYESLDALESALEGQGFSAASGGLT